MKQQSLQPGVFDLVAPYEPAGDQPAAIDALARGVAEGRGSQVLMGVTGSGKTFTMANVIARVGRPTLVLSHNKTLAAQLYAEFRDFFPHNAVHYFVSYYDYYQPEAYIPQRDIYIEKDAAINKEIDRLRLAATSALVSRRDVVVVASVSCIYGLGSPADYRAMVVRLASGSTLARDELLAKLVSVHYERGDVALERGRFRVRGDSIDIWPPYDELACRVEFRRVEAGARSGRRPPSLLRRPDPSGRAWSRSSPTAARPWCAPSTRGPSSRRPGRRPGPWRRVCAYPPR